MTKLYKNTEQKALNIGSVFRKCKHPGCPGAATEDTLGYCIKHLQSSTSQERPVEDLTDIMDTVQVRSRDKKRHPTRSHRRKSPGIHIGDNIRRLDRVRSKDTHFVLHLDKDNKVIYHQSHDPDLEESSDLLDFSYEESRDRRRRCIGPGCFNMGSCDFNGLCCDCYKILLLSHQQEGSLGASNCLGGQGWCGGNLHQLDSVHKLYSQHRGDMVHRRREWCQLPPEQSSFKSGSMNMQEGPEPDILNEQPNLIEFSIQETPDQRQSNTGQTDARLVDLSLRDTNLTETVDNTINLLDLSLTERAQYGDEDARNSKVMNSNTCALESSTCHRKPPNLGDEEDGRKETMVSDVRVDLRLPDEVLQTSTNRTDNHELDLQPEMQVLPTEVTKSNEATRTLNSRTCNHRGHTQPVMSRLPSGVSKTVNSRTCNHGVDINPEMKVLNTTPCKQKQDTHYSHRSGKEHMQDVKCSNIPKGHRKHIQTQRDQNDTDFNRLIQDIEEQSKMSAHKCLASDCENFGNSRCLGLCNCCYKTLTST